MPAWIKSMAKNETKESYAKNYLYFGMELELAAPLDMDELPYHDDLNIQLGSDCSIAVSEECPEQYEYRFHPGTWGWWVEHRSQLTRFLRTLRESGCVTGTNHNCGLHIHFSDVLRDDHSLNLMQLVYQNPDEMFLLSNRTKGQMDWCKIEFPARQPDSSWTCTCETCMAQRALASYGGKVTNRESITKLRSVCSDKYTALSIRPGTMELRLFSGSLNARQVWGAMEFLRAGIEYTVPDKFNPDHDGSITSFRAWLTTTPGYNCLKWMLNKALGRIQHEAK